MISLWNVSLKNQRANERRLLGLISSFRAVPLDLHEVTSLKTTSLFEAFSRALKQRQPAFDRLLSIQQLQLHWDDWFKGTSFQKCVPMRIDRWHCLWIKAPNGIVKQKLQFKTDVFLKAVKNLVAEKIESVRWL